MKRSLILLTALALATVGLSACGGSSAPTTPTDSARARAERSAGDEDDEGERRDDDEEEDEEDEGGDEFPLDTAQALPGTGVSMRPPRGSEAMELGSGFLHQRRRIQIIVAVTEGDDELLTRFREGLAANAEEVDTEEVAIGGHTAQLTIDRQDQDGLEIERAWVFVRQGQRALAIMGAYQAERAERVRGLVRASVLSASWDPSALLDPESALGYRVAPIEGLSIDRSTSQALTYTMPGHIADPGSGEPALYVLPLPVDIPMAQRDELCQPILAQVGPVPEDRATSHGEIETDTLEGCELIGTQTPPEGATDASGGTPRTLATYAALVYHADATLLVAGVVDASQSDPWIERFRAAARTVASVR